MKKLLLGLVFLSLFFTACNDDDTQELIVEEAITSEDMTTAENISMDIMEVADEQMEVVEAGLADLTANTRGGGCVEITLENPWGIFPNTITLDFGDGCTGPKGRTRSGKIIITVSDTMKNAGATRTLTFEDFFVEDVQVIGSIIRTNDGINDLGQPQHSRNTDIELVFPNGKTASWSGTQTVTLVEGVNTPGMYDNVYEITGSTDGVNRNGTPYTTAIEEPLVKVIGCPWLVSGIRSLTVNDNTRTIDYGDGECDNKAIVTFANGNTKEIIIHKKWWK
jgi:hypothetical protein